MLGRCHREVGLRRPVCKSFEVDEDHLTSGSLDQVALVGIPMHGRGRQREVKRRVLAAQTAKSPVEKLPLRSWKFTCLDNTLGDPVKDVEFRQRQAVGNLKTMDPTQNPRQIREAGPGSTIIDQLPEGNRSTTHHQWLIVISSLSGGKAVLA